MYKGLKRVSEGGLEQGSSRALKVANGEGIYVFEVTKQRLLSQCLFFGDNSVHQQYERRLTIV